MMLSPLTVGGTIPANAQGDEASVQAVVESFARFSQEKNLGGIDSLWAPEEWVHIIEGAGVNHGWTDYRDHHLGPELEGFENFTYRFLHLLRGQLSEKT